MGLGLWLGDVTGELGIRVCGSCKLVVQYFYSSFTVVVQYFYSSCTVVVQ